MSFLKSVRLLNLSALIVFIAILSTPASALGPAAGSGYSVGQACTHSGGFLNMRSNAGQGFKVIKKIKSGANLVILDSKTGSDGMEWYQVRSGKDIGWVRFDYVCF